MCTDPTLGEMAQYPELTQQPNYINLFFNERISSIGKDLSFCLHTYIYLFILQGYHRYSTIDDIFFLTQTLNNRRHGFFKFKKKKIDIRRRFRFFFKFNFSLYMLYFFICYVYKPMLYTLRSNERSLKRVKSLQNKNEHRSIGAKIIGYL